MENKEKTLMDLINDCNFTSSPPTDIEDNLGEIPLSKAFTVYKFALKNPDQLYALSKEDNPIDEMLITERLNITRELDI